MRPVSVPKVRIPHLWPLWPQVYACLEENCSAWTDHLPAKMSKTSGKPQGPHKLRADSKGPTFQTAWKKGKTVWPTKRTHHSWSILSWRAEVLAILGHPKWGCALISSISITSAATWFCLSQSLDPKWGRPLAVGVFFCLGIRLNHPRPRRCSFVEMMTSQGQTPARSSDAQLAIQPRLMFVTPGSVLVSEPLVGHTGHILSFLKKKIHIQRWQPVASRFKVFWPAFRSMPAPEGLVQTTLTGLTVEATIMPHSPCLAAVTYID